MKIQLLIGICQSDYAEHLSRVLAEKHADVFEVSVCSKPELLGQTMDKRRFDAALLDGEMAGAADLSAVRLPLLVWDGASPLEGAAQDLPRVRKYQRISAISSDVVERYAAISGPQESFQSSRAKITAVWSPTGGSGKTAVALALAARRAAQGRQTVYLDLEPFSALQSYFKEPGKSISGVFEKLDGDVALLFQGIRQRDSASGVYYFGAPMNYDDMNILTPEDVVRLLEGCAANADEVVVDLGSVCDGRTRKILELADQVWLVGDGSMVCRAKCHQFRTQHDVYGEIAPKLTVVANRGARNVALPEERELSLPKVNADDPAAVYRALAEYIK